VCVLDFLSRDRVPIKTLQNRLYCELGLAPDRQVLTVWPDGLPDGGLPPSVTNMAALWAPVRRDYPHGIQPVPADRLFTGLPSPLSSTCPPVSWMATPSEHAVACRCAPDPYRVLLHPLHSARLPLPPARPPKPAPIVPRARVLTGEDMLTGPSRRGPHQKVYPLTVWLSVNTADVSAGTGTTAAAPAAAVDAKISPQEAALPAPPQREEILLVERKRLTAGQTRTAYYAAADAKQQHSTATRATAAGAVQRRARSAAAAVATLSPPVQREDEAPRSFRLHVREFHLTQSLDTLLQNVTGAAFVTAYRNGRLCEETECDGELYRRLTEAAEADGLTLELAYR
jgi:hypothetical protein